MKKNAITLAVLALASSHLVGARTHDVSFAFRMGAGFPGDVNRTHPASIVPRQQTATVASKVRLYGDPVLIDPATNSVRGFLAADTAVTKIYGVLVRPYPTQQQTGGMNAAFGTASPPDGAAVVDILNEGFVIARCNNFAAVQPALGGAVYVRVAATAGPLIQGGFHSAADGANTVLVTNATWCGPTDSNGITEIQVAAPLA
jgi:hypothetical protein